MCASFTLHSHLSKMSTKKKQTPHSSRRPLADFGLMVAVALMVVFGLRVAIFGLTVLSIVILVLSVAYCVMSVKCNSHSPLFLRSTVVFLLLTAGVMVASVYLDRPTRPKRTAFQRVERTDTVAEQELVVETPAPVAVDSSDAEVADTFDVALPDSMKADIEIPALEADSLSTQR